MDIPSKLSQLLLIDTCGETAGVALSRGGQILAAEDFVQGSASAQIVSAMRRLLGQAGLKLVELDAIGVVRGPGSFTGMRAGLAAAKGLCEATGLPLVAVSRLKVLAEASPTQVRFAVLDAGRGELYLRDETEGRESLCSVEAMREITAGEPVAVAEARIVEQLQPTCTIVLYPLHVVDAVGPMLEAWDHAQRGQSLAEDEVLVDANYIRQESDIYSKASKTSAGD